MIPSGSDTSVLASLLFILAFGTCGTAVGSSGNAVLLDVERVRRDGVERAEAGALEEEVGDTLVLLLGGAATIGSDGETGEVASTSASEVGSLTCTMHTKDRREGCQEASIHEYSKATYLSTLSSVL